MKNLILKNALFTYHNLKRSTQLRLFIKKIIGTGKIEYDFNGFKIFAGTTSAIESNIIFNQYNEIAVLKLIAKYASQDYHFIDIGANIGIHSLTAAAANTSIEIFSFEPETNNFLSFIKNIGLNRFQNIRPFKMGLGNFKGNTSLNINDGWNKGKHSLKVIFDDNATKLNIPVIQLDGFIDYFHSDNLLLKIDVEGFEKEVIEGGLQLIDKIPNMVIIMELVIEINGAATCQEIIAILQAHHFVAVYKINSRNHLERVSAFDGSADYVFLKGEPVSKNDILDFL